MLAVLLVWPGQAGGHSFVPYFVGSMVLAGLLQLHAGRLAGRQIVTRYSAELADRAACAARS